MPLDATNYTDDGALAFADFKNRPTLKGLSYALRHPEVWPDGFVWDFSDCSRCAMGLAAELAGQFATQQVYPAKVATSKLLSLDMDVVETLFDMVREYAGLPLYCYRIQASDIARAIDQYLASVP